MAIEISIRARAPLATVAVEAAIREVLAPFAFGALTWAKRGAIGPSEFVAELHVDEGEIALLGGDVPDVPGGEDELYAGTVVELTVIHRVPESQLLLLAAGVVLARLWGEPIIDESKLFGLGRTFTAEAGARLLASLEPQSFATAAQQLAARLERAAMVRIELERDVEQLRDLLWKDRLRDFDAVLDRVQRARDPGTAAALLSLLDDRDDVVEECFSILRVAELCDDYVEALMADLLRLVQRAPVTTETLFCRLLNEEGSRRSLGDAASRQPEMVKRCIERVLRRIAEQDARYAERVRDLIARMPA